MNRTCRSLAAAVVGLLITTCKDSTGPVAGVLKVNLTTPHSGADGAVMLVLASPVAPHSVTPAPGLALWGASVPGVSLRVVLTGTLSSGSILSLQVDDINKVGQYSVTLEQVAASNGYGLRLPLTGYSATVTK